MFTLSLQELKEGSRLIRAKTAEIACQTRKTIIQYIRAIVLESKLVDDKEQARQEMHYNFDYEDIMKEVESYFIVKSEHSKSLSYSYVYIFRYKYTYSYSNGYSYTYSFSNRYNYSCS